MANDEYTPGKPIEELFHERLRAEHDLIAHRMSWLMTLNGFLIGGAAVMVANSDRFDDSASLNGVLLMVAILGAVSNASCLFSNYWGTAAIRGAGAALLAAWDDLDEEQKQRRIDRMRLYGRDPLAFRRPGRALTWWMHPWILLPGLFTIALALVPMVSPAVSDGDVDLSWLLRTAPVWALTPFVVFPVIEDRRKRRRAELPQ